jgi:hypothetical protein
MFVSGFRNRRNPYDPKEFAVHEEHFHLYKLFLRRIFEEKQQGKHRPRIECRFGYFGKRDCKELGYLKIMFTNKVFVPVCLKGKGTLTLISLSTGFSYCFSPCILAIPSYAFALFITNSIYEPFPFFFAT